MFAVLGDRLDGQLVLAYGHGALLHDGIALLPPAARSHVAAHRLDHAAAARRHGGLTGGGHVFCNARAKTHTQTHTSENSQQSVHLDVLRQDEASDSGVDEGHPHG